MLQTAVCHGLLYAKGHCMPRVAVCHRWLYATGGCMPWSTVCHWLLYATGLLMPQLWIILVGLGQLGAGLVLSYLQWEVEKLLARLDLPLVRVE